MEVTFNVAKDGAKQPATFTLSPVFRYGDGTDRYQSVWFYGLREDVDTAKIWPAIESVLTALDLPWDGRVPTALAWQSIDEVAHQIGEVTDVTVSDRIGFVTGNYRGGWAEYLRDLLPNAIPRKPLLRYCHIGWDGIQKGWWY